MIIFAGNDETAQFMVDTYELDPRILKATGFRTKDAEYDASQDVDTFMIGNHQFNLAGVENDSE